MKFTHAFNVSAIILVFTVVVLIGLPTTSKPLGLPIPAPVIGSFKWDCNGNGGSGALTGQINITMNSYAEFSIADCSQSTCSVSLGEFKSGPLNNVKLGIQSVFKYRSREEVELNQLNISAQKGTDWVGGFGLNAPRMTALNTLGDLTDPFHVRLSVAVPGLIIQPEGYTPPTTEVWCTFKFSAPSSALTASTSTQSANSL